MTLQNLPHVTLMMGWSSLSAIEGRSHDSLPHNNNYPLQWVLNFQSSANIGCLRAVSGSLGGRIDLVSSWKSYKSGFSGFL